MEQIAEEALTDAVKKKILKALKIDPDDLEDLGGFESFVFHRRSNNAIIRMTHISHRHEDQIRAEMEFIHYLSGKGAAVCNPIAFDDGNLVMKFDEFIISQFERAPGHPPAADDLDSGLFRKWGKCIGEFHHFARQMPAPEYKRMDWRADENLDFRRRIPEHQEKLLSHADRYLQQLARLPVSGELFGLIHCDAHGGNFFVDQGGLTFFDFDDCGYQWFGYDVATVLLGAVLMPSVESTRLAQEQEAIRFLKPFLKGYHSVMPFSPFLLDQMDLFLKVRELSLYAVIHAHMDVDNLQDWYPKKFMHDRERRLQADEPYLNLDFPKLFST